MLADAFAQEWPAWAARVSRETIEQGFHSGPEGCLPSVFVASVDGAVAGTVALRAWFGEAPTPQTPWVRGLFVFPRFRGRGVDRVLFGAAEHEARVLGHSHLYGATTRIERLALRRGWRVFDRLEHEGEPMAWLVKPLA